jgi:hypothetical protein
MSGNTAIPGTMGSPGPAAAGGPGGACGFGDGGTGKQAPGGAAGKPGVAGGLGAVGPSSAPATRLGLLVFDQALASLADGGDTPD